MKVSHLIPKSRLTFSVPVITLIAVFFIGYYFYYIPVNKDVLHKNGFLILQNIEAAIVERNSDYQNLYKNYFDKSGGKIYESDALASSKSLQGLLDRNNIEGKVFSLSNIVAMQNGADTLQGYTGYDSTRDEFQATAIQQNNFAYLFKNETHASRILLSADSILNPVFQSQKKELFESYLLVDKKDGLVYKDPGLSIMSNIQLDSLLPGTHTQFASVGDIKIENVAYKIFSYPFHFANDDVLLCGLVKAKEYSTSLHEIPVSFIYPIVIALIVLLIFLPIIKFYLIGDDETVRLIDVSLSAISFIIGPALLTLILIQVLLLWSADMRAKSYLAKLSSQIDTGFTSDIVSAYRQLDLLDSLVSTEDSIRSKMNNGGNINISDQIIQYFREHTNTPGLDYNFDRIFWADSLGSQRIKGQVGRDEPLFTNVATRKYFQVFKNNTAYMLPGDPGSFFGFEPITSWADGEFRIIISKVSRFQHGFIVAVATQMPSVTQTILPPGFGFCIIDNAGNVQLHSDMNRNLRENIIEKMSPSRSIKEAISSRQASYFTDIKFYGKANAVNINPVSKIPFSLITFYDKGYIVPITMRIFTFALLFCLLSFFIYFVTWIVFIRKHYYANPLLYSPLVFLKWAIPKKASGEFYVVSTYFLVAYIIMLLIFMGLSGLLGISNYVILVLVLLTPVNVISGLFVINYSTTKEDADPKDKRAIRHKKKAVRAIAFQFLCSLIIYFYSRYFAYPIENQFLIFQAIFHITMWLFYLSPEKKFRSISKSKKYLSQYSGLATTLILSLAVLPAGLYTWYAHNQEITQSLKKGQLYLAEALQNRRPSVIKFAENQDKLKAPVGYFDMLQYHSGIYKIYSDSINWKDDSLFAMKQNGSYEQFYFAIANEIGNNYYDPLLFPSLKDSASDRAWYWSRQDNTLLFRYLLPNNFSSGRKNQDSVKSLNIISTFPPRYQFVGFSFRALLLILIVVLLIRGLYILVRSLAERIFLKKFIDDIDGKRSNENKIENLVLEFNRTYKKPYPGFDTDVKNLVNEYDYYVPADTNTAIYKQEKDMIDTIKKLKTFYNFLWQKCTEKEKYLLLDFAKDSLVNFKNIEPIYCLLENGLFIIHDHEIKLFSVSFRAYVLEKANTPEIYQMQKKFKQNSNWQSFRIPVLIILLGVALFIFFTQEETFQKLAAIVAGASSVLSLLVKFFVNGNSDAFAKK
ncbi:MAG: hypothetical protein ABI472_06775 [Ginsengibacter sp.]